MLSTTHELDDGSRVRLRLTRPSVAPGLAEIGIVVDDENQGRGLGKVLSEAVASLALQRGATRLKAEMLDGNAPMLRLLERLGRTVRTVEDGRSVAYTRLSQRRRGR